MFNSTPDFVIMIGTLFPEFSVYPTDTHATDARHLTTPVVVPFGVSVVFAPGRICVWPPGEVG